MADYNANHAVRIDGLYSESATPAGTNGVPLGIEYRVPYTSGSGDYKSNLYYASRMLTSGTNIDLNGGSIADPLGNSITFTTIRGILVVNRSVTTGETCTLSGDFVTSVLMSGGAGSIVIKPGGIYYVEAPVDGYTVVQTTGDNIVFTFTNQTLGIDVFMWGS